MTPKQIILIQTSFEQVLPIADTAAELFYGRLFELDSSLKPLFRGNMAEQGRKLMTTLKVVVNGLPRLEALVQPYKPWASGTLAMELRTNITRPSVQPCCGRWSKGWAKLSPRKLKMPG